VSIQLYDNVRGCRLFLSEMTRSAETAITVEKALDGLIGGSHDGVVEPQEEVTVKFKVYKSFPEPVTLSV